MIQKIYSESFQKCTLPNSKRHSTSCADIHHDLITFEVDEQTKYKHKKMNTQELKEKQLKKK